MKVKEFNTIYDRYKIMNMRLILPTLSPAEREEYRRKFENRTDNVSIQIMEMLKEI